MIIVNFSPRRRTLYNSSCMLSVGKLLPKRLTTWCGGYTVSDATIITRATILSPAGVMSAVFNLEQLIDMMSIGTLLAYSIVCICVLVLRYKNDSDVEFIIKGNDESESSSFFEIIVKTVVKYFNISNIKYANEETECVSKVITILFSKSRDRVTGCRQ